MRAALSLLLLYFCGISLFLSCSNPPNRPDDPAPVDYCIYLTGKVVKKDGTPLQHTLVKLGGLPYSASTDSTGIYLISLPKAGVLTTFSDRLAAGTYTDTLAFIADGQTFEKFRISDWVDTLPDVIVAEINVSGNFGTGAQPALRTEAVIAVKDSSAAPDDRIINLLYVPSTRSFTGFVYLKIEAGSPIYALHINVYGPDSLLTGRSGTIAFSSQTSRVNVPFFSPRNAVPVCDAGNTQRIGINDSFRLTGTASDSFSVIVSWEWDIGNTGTWVDVMPDSSWRGIAPDQPHAAFPCILRVTNKNGAIGLDTVIIQISEGLPLPAASAQKAVVSIKDTIRLSGSAADGFGIVVGWEWDAGNTGAFIETTPDSAYIAIAPDSAHGAYPCVLRVTDDDGNSALDTVFINVVADPPVPAASAVKMTVSLNDTIRLRGSAADSFGKVVGWEWDPGNTGVFIETTPDSAYIEIAPDSVHGAYPCVLRVTDDDGNNALDTVFINVVADPPVPAASAVKMTVSVSDTIRLRGSAADSFGKIVGWEWDPGNTGVFIETTPDSGTIAIAPDSARSAYPCILRVTDDDGNIALDTVFINVITDPPVPAASAVKTTVSLNDTIRLRGSAADSFGKIVGWEWDPGNTGVFIETTPDSACIAIAPDSARSTYPCILRVTDDDGNSALDTVFISVVTDPPVPSASAVKMIVSLNDTIRLRGSAADSFGKVVGWEWDPGNTGVFIETTPDSVCIAIAPDSARSTYPCILRVTDDDGNIALDTVFISVIADPPVPSASAVKTTVSLNDTILLRGSAADSFGKVVGWEWDPGNTGAFVETTPDSGSIAIAPDSAHGTYPCVLRVTDDDGNSALDTVFIGVIIDPPVASASALSTTVAVNEPIELRGTARDVFGRIVTWDWDAGNTGAFLEVTPDSNYTAYAPDTATSNFPCVLRVTDDDGNSVTDTVSITVIPTPASSGSEMIAANRKLYR